jgi:hypothetical protein
LGVRTVVALIAIYYYYYAIGVTRYAIADVGFYVKYLKSEGDLCKYSSGPDIN